MPLCSQLSHHRTSGNASAQAQVDQTKLQQAEKDVIIIHLGALKYLYHPKNGFSVENGCEL